MLSLLVAGRLSGGRDSRKLRDVLRAAWASSVGMCWICARAVPVAGPTARREEVANSLDLVLSSSSVAG